MNSLNCRVLLLFMTFVGLSTQAQSLRSQVQLGDAHAQFKCLELIDSALPLPPVLREIQSQPSSDSGAYIAAAGMLSQSLIQNLDVAVRNPARSRVKLGASIEVNGKVRDYWNLQGRAAYINFSKETKISELLVNPQGLLARELPNQGDNLHKEGFGTAVGDFTMRKLEPVTQPNGISSRLKNFDAYFRDLRPHEQPNSLDFIKNRVSLDFDNGIRVSGKLMAVTRHSQSRKIILLTFVDCLVTYTDPTTLEVKKLFKPEAGPYYLILAPEIAQVITQAQ